jgi:hypothetical protein
MHFAARAWKLAITDLNQVRAWHVYCWVGVKLYRLRVVVVLLC